MRVIVDLNACQDHGQCVFAAPQVFELDPEGRLSLRNEVDGSVYEGDVEEAHRDLVEEAADVCPLQAIRIEDSVRERI